jgi:hypothetical protein
MQQVALLSNRRINQRKQHVSFSACAAAATAAAATCSFDNALTMSSKPTATRRHSLQFLSVLSLLVRFCRPLTDQKMMNPGAAAAGGAAAAAAAGQNLGQQLVVHPHQTWHSDLARDPFIGKSRSHAR